MHAKPSQDRETVTKNQSGENQSREPRKRDCLLAQGRRRDQVGLIQTGGEKARCRERRRGGRAGGCERAGGWCDRRRGECHTWRSKNLYPGGYRDFHMVERPCGEEELVAEDHHLSIGRKHGDQDDRREVCHNLGGSGDGPYPEI